MRQKRILGNEGKDNPLVTHDGYLVLPGCYPNYEVARELNALSAVGGTE